MSKFWKIVALCFVAFILLGAGWELIRRNTTLKNAVATAEEREAAYQLAIDAFEKALSELDVDLDSAAVVNAYLQEDLKNIITIRDERINTTVPNLVDVMSYTEQQKRDTISSTARYIIENGPKLRELQQRNSEEQGHNEIPLRP